MPLAVTGGADAKGFGAFFSEPRLMCSPSLGGLGGFVRNSEAGQISTLLHGHRQAVTEVMQKAGEHPGYGDFMRALPTSSGVVTTSQRPETSLGHAEFCTVIWTNGAARMCDGWRGLRYFDDVDDVFSREPAYGCFVAGNFDFILGLYHARWAGGSSRRIRNEVRNIPAVFQAMVVAAPGERDLLMMGDFNLTPYDLARALPFADQTEGVGSTINGSGSRTGNLYDHLLVYDDRASIELNGRAQVLDVMSVATSRAAFYRTVSDHLPIQAVFDITRADDD